MRRSPTNDTKPPAPWFAHDGQIAGAATSIVATRSRRPVVGHGIVLGPASCREMRFSPSSPACHRNRPLKRSVCEAILAADGSIGESCAKVAELADAPALGAGSRKAMGVRVPPFAFTKSPARQRQK